MTYQFHYFVFYLGEDFATCLPAPSQEIIYKLEVSMSSRRDQVKGLQDRLITELGSNGTKDFLDWLGISSSVQHRISELIQEFSDKENAEASLLGLAHDLGQLARDIHDEGFLGGKDQIELAAVIRVIYDVQHDLVLLFIDTDTYRSVVAQLKSKYQTCLEQMRKNPRRLQASHEKARNILRYLMDLGDPWSFNQAAMQGLVTTNYNRSSVMAAAI